MKISICSPAIATAISSDMRIEDDTILASLDGCHCAESVGEYLDMDLADLGIIGGAIRCSFSDLDGLKLWIEYWAPNQLREDDLAKLVQYTIAQWEDGVGESGFRFELESGSVDVFVSCEEEEADVRQIDDGTYVPAPSRVAISARNGVLGAIAAAIQAGESIEGTLQGYSALHLAILYGNVEAAVMLIEHGADVNRTDSQGESPLHLCATSHSLTDEQSAAIALALIEGGADTSRPSSTGDTAAALAETRGKVNLERLLCGS